MQGTARVSGQTTGALMMTMLLGQLSLGAALPLGFTAAAGFALVAGVVSLFRIFT
jgi:DHA2 family multidrug resistance protein-like MFS transporter